MPDQPKPTEPIDLQKHRDTIALATPGPWYTHEHGKGAQVRTMPGQFSGDRICSVELADAMFIAEAREGWPAAVAEVERLRAELKRIEWVRDDCDMVCPSCTGYRDDGHEADCELAALLGTP